MQEIIWALTALPVLALSYKYFPFYRWKKVKPSFVLLPKYTAKYTHETDVVINNIKSMGFMLKKDEDNLFVRGKPYGDFLAKWTRIEIHVDRSNKEIKVYSPFIGILFDTGDLWKIINSALSESGDTL